MPYTPPVHMNPKATNGKTRCGRLLRQVKAWRGDEADVTCNQCLRLLENDKRREKAGY